MALGLVTPFARAARAARTVLRGASCGFAAVLVARLRRGVGYAASPLTSQRPKIDQRAVADESRKSRNKSEKWGAADTLPHIHAHFGHRCAINGHLWASLHNVLQVVEPFGRISCCRF